MTLISALTGVTVPALADEYEIEQAGASFKISGTQIYTLFRSTLLGTANTFTAAQTDKVSDAGTNTTTVVRTLGHNSTGTPAASFGVGLKFTLETTTTEDQDAAQIEAIWTTATHASRTSSIVFSTVNSAAALAEAARLTPTQAVFPVGSASVPGITFIGNTTDGLARSGGPSIIASGALVATFASNRAQLSGSLPLAWGNGNASVAIDTLIRRNAAGVVEFSTDNNNVGRWASLKAGTYDSGTNTITDGLTLGHRSSGTPAAGLGMGILLNIDSSTTADQNAVRLTAEWVVATHASRAARAKLQVYDTAAREVLRGEASGSAAMIGFLGANAATRQTSGADLTNNVTIGGTDDTIANFTDLTTYANDSAAIRNDIYQLARKLKQVNDAMRLYGLLT